MASIAKTRGGAKMGFLNALSLVVPEIPRAWKSTGHM